MPRGKVIFFNKKSNFGFIKNSDSDESYYVNGKSMQGTVEQNDEVEFDLKEAKRGKEAVNVKKINS